MKFCKFPSPLKLLIEKYRSIREDYLNRSPRGKWNFARNIGVFFLKFCGIDYLDPHFELWWYSYFTFLIIFNIFLSTIYTIWYYWDSPLRGLRCLSSLGITIPSACLYAQLFHTKSRKIIQELAFFSGKNIYLNITPESDPKYVRASNQSVMELFRNLVVVLSLTSTSVSLFGIYPMYAFIWNHELELPFPIFVPFTNTDSTSGIFINVLNQFVTNLIGLFGTMGSEVAFVMVKKTFSAITMAIEYSIESLTDSIERPELKRSPKEIDLEFRNLMIQIQDFDRYSKNASDIYYWRYFLQPHMLCFGVSLCLFFYFHGNWGGAIAVLIFSYTQLYVLCDFGEEHNFAKAKLLLKLHEMPWYLMSKRNQLDYAHTLNRLQNGVVISMGPFSQLNYGSFSNMTKRIYTVVMTIIKLYK